MKRYGLSIVLFLLFAASWAWQYYTHDESLTKFFNATAENWQSEFLQLLTFVILSTYLIHKGSPQSRDGDDEMKAKIDEILRRLKE